MANLRYAPEFQVTINGEPIPSVLRRSISAVSYETGLEGADRVELTVSNDNLRWLDQPLFALGNTLSLSLGYAPKPLERVFVGEIFGQAPTFPGGGMPTLTVVAQDRMQRLQEGSKTRWFATPLPKLANYPIPDPLVVSVVSLENGLIPITDLVGGVLTALLSGAADMGIAFLSPEEGQKLIRKQVGESDFTFLTRIARENGWELVIDHSGDLGGHKLRFLPLVNRITPELTFRYGRSLIEFSPRITDVGQIVAYTVRLWVPQIKTEFTVTVAWNWDRSSLDVSIAAGFRLPSAVPATPEALRQAVDKAKTPLAKEEAEATLQEAQEKIAEPSLERKTTTTLTEEPLTLASVRRVLLPKLISTLNQRLTGSARTIGDSRIKAGTLLRIEGLGRQFGGLYRVTKATHTIDSGGYQTSFEVRKDFWFGSIPLREQKQVQAGLLSIASPSLRL